jgi:hypothetical protein
MFGVAAVACAGSAVPSNVPSRIVSLTPALTEILSPSARDLSSGHRVLRLPA